MRALRRILDQQLPSPWLAQPGPCAEGMALAGREAEGPVGDGPSWRCLNPEGQPPCFHLRAACELADRERAYALGYRTYRAMGYARQEERRILVLPCDARPDTLTVLATAPGARPAGTLSLWLDLPAGLPCEALYPGEVAALREAGGRLAEVGRFSIHDDYRHCIMLIARLLNLVFLYACRRLTCSHLVCTVSPRHAAFYLRKLRFRRLGPPRAYRRVNGATAELLALDLEVYAREVRRAHAPHPWAGRDGRATQAGAGGLAEPGWAVQEAGLYRRFLDPDREGEAAALLARTQCPMPSEMIDYFRLSR